MAVITGYKPTFGQILDQDHVNIAPVDLFGDLLYEERTSGSIPDGRDTTFTDNYPIAGSPVNYSGALVTGFGDDWYNNIHIVPSTLDLGVLPSAQLRTVELWNSYLVEQTLSAIDTFDTDGITYYGVSAPSQIAPLELRYVTLDVSMDGPASIASRWVFHFIGRSATLRAIGSRVTMFAFKPNWAENLLERYEWKTDVLSAYDGTEQRISVRLHPRKRVEFSVLLGAEESAYLDAAITGSQSRLFAVPTWQDMHRAMADIPIGSSVIYLDTEYLSYSIDGDMVVGTSWEDNEALQVAAIYGDRVELKRPTIRAWPAGSWIVPAVVARMESTQSVNRPTHGIVTARLAFSVHGLVPLTAVDSPITYQGIPIVAIKANEVDEREVAYTRLHKTIDSDTGVLWVDDVADVSLHRRTWQYRMASRAAIDEAVKWLAARSGRRIAYWQPVYELGIVPVDEIVSNVPSIVVQKRGYGRHAVTVAGKGTIWLRTVGGVSYFREVVGISDGLVDGTEVLNLSSALGVALQPHEIAHVLWMEKHRLDTDAVEVSWHTDSVADIEVTTIEVKG